MKSERIAASALILAIAGVLCLTLNMACVLAEEVPVEDPSRGLESFVDAVGTHFEVNDSPYLDVTLASSESVHAVLQSASRTISLFVESVSSATSTSLTFSGLADDCTYYRYQDGYLMEEFTADTEGGYAYTQDISEPHHVHIQEHASTLYISSDYTFTSDISEPIVVTADDIVIDGNGYTLQGTGAGYGFYLYGRSGVTIKNVTVTDWFSAIYQYACVGNTLSSNSITNNYYGIDMSADNDGNSLSSNTLVDNTRGIFLYRYNDNNAVVDNSLTGNWYGIYLFASDGNTLMRNSITDSFRAIYLYSQNHDNTVSENAITNNRRGIDLEWYNYDNTMYHNNIIENLNQAYDYLPASNNWHHPERLEGNYWSDYLGADDGSGTGKHAIAGDGIGDTSIPWHHDFYPLMYPRVSNPTATCYELIETIESWDLRKGPKNCLISKLEEAIDLWERGNTNGAIRKIGDFIKQVTNDRKDLTEDQRSHLLRWANGIVAAMMSPPS